MAGFVGYCVHANGIHFPWKTPGDELCAPGVSPPELWQNIPFEAKLQIILTIGLFEFYSEAAMSKGVGQGGHYMRGGKPGAFPAFKGSTKGVLGDADGRMLLPHPVPLNLYDPFNFNKNKGEIRGGPVRRKNAEARSYKRPASVPCKVIKKPSKRIM